MSKHITPNDREVLYAVSSITGQAEYLTSTGHRLDIDGSVTLVTVGATNFTTGQVALSSAGVLISTANSTRTSITIVNLNTTDIYIGAIGVTTSTGQLLLGTKGAAITLEVVGAIYGVVATGTPLVSYEEEYN